MNYQNLLIRREGGVDWVTLNRPDALNTLSPAMTEELLDYFGGLYRNHDVRIVVLKGAGRAFCAGLDLKGDSESGAGSLEVGSVAYTLRFQRNISEIVMRMRRCPQAIVSLVHGPACGGGFAMALASDIRIAGESAKMNAAFIKLGLSGCDIGVSYFLPRLVGVSLASELIMTGRFIMAERALQLGLVSEVVADDQLEAAGQKLVAELLRTSPLGLRLTKECLNMSVDAGSLEAAVAMEDRNQALTTQSEDFVEGINAFVEKREPVYRDQ
jgi:enoyl-CoA hydratase